MIQDDKANLHAEKQARLPLPPHSLYSCTAAALRESLGAGAYSAPGEVAPQGALDRDGREHDGEHVAQAAARSMTPPMALRMVLLAAPMNARSETNLQARGAHVEDALREHVANFVAARVATPHALQAGSVRVCFGLAQGREGNESSDHVPTPPALQNKRRVPESGKSMTLQHSSSI